MKLLYGTKNVPKYEMYFQKALLFTYNDVLIEDILKLVRQYICDTRGDVYFDKYTDRDGNKYQGVVLSTANETPHHKYVRLIEKRLPPYELERNYETRAYNPKLHLVSDLRTFSVYYGVHTRIENIDIKNDCGLFFVRSKIDDAETAFCGIKLNTFPITDTQECIDIATSKHYEPAYISDWCPYSLKEAFTQNKLTSKVYRGFTGIFRELYPGLQYFSFPMVLIVGEL